MGAVCGIYKITSPSGKVYIGQSVHIMRRWSKYRSKHFHEKQYKIHRSLKKYGWKLHIFEIIEECEKFLLNDREAYWIKFYNSFEKGLNLTTGGGNNCKLSFETIEKMRKVKLNKPPRSEEYRENCGRVNRGRKRSKETCDKISKCGIGRKPWNKGIKTGHIPWNKGKKHSEETKQKVKDTIAKLNRVAWNKGKKLSPEHIQKLSLARKGKKIPRNKNYVVSDETRRKLSIARRKRVISSETKEKIRQTLLKKYAK